MPWLLNCFSTLDKLSNMKAKTVPNRVVNVIHTQSPWLVTTIICLFHPHPIYSCNHAACIPHYLPLVFFGIIQVPIVLETKAGTRYILSLDLILRKNAPLGRWCFMNHAPFAEKNHPLPRNRLMNQHYASIRESIKIAPRLFLERGTGMSMVLSNWVISPLYSRLDTSLK